LQNLRDRARLAEELRLQNLLDKVRLAEAREERRKAAEPIRQQMAELRAAKARQRIEAQLKKQAQEEDRPLIIAAREAWRAARAERKQQKRAELNYIPVLKLLNPHKSDLTITSSANIAAPSTSDPSGKIVLKIRASDLSGVRYVLDDVAPVLSLSAQRPIGIAKLRHHRIRFKMSGHKRWACDRLGLLPN
jgi:hypothetical protein